MNRDLAERLKSAGFPIHDYRAGHRFYPSAATAGWSEGARRHGVIVTAADLQERRQDMADGYYCPDLSDLIEACGAHFGGLTLEKDIWTAVCKNPDAVLRGASPEEAVAKLWFALRERDHEGIAAKTAR